MTLPHTYTDDDGAHLAVSRSTGRIEITEIDDVDSDVVQAHAIVSAPTGPDAVALAKAILEAAGDTGCEVIDLAMGHSGEGISCAESDELVEKEIDRLRARVAELEERQRGTDRLVADTAVSMRERSINAAMRTFANPGPGDVAQRIAIVDAIRNLPLFSADAPRPVPAPLTADTDA